MYMYNFVHVGICTYIYIYILVVLQETLLTVLNSLHTCIHTFTYIHTPSMHIVVSFRQRLTDHLVFPLRHRPCQIWVSASNGVNTTCPQITYVERLQILADLSRNLSRSHRPSNDPRRLTCVHVYINMWRSLSHLEQSPGRYGGRNHRSCGSCHCAGRSSNCPSVALGKPQLGMRAAS